MKPTELFPKVYFSWTIFVLSPLRNGPNEQLLAMNMMKSVYDNEHTNIPWQNPNLRQYGY